jgi:Reverse transcriptase (RNA-dependent DNA polymerase)
MLNALLTAGFLPKELPPFFSSKSLENILISGSLPNAFVAATGAWTRPAKHNLARPGGTRRRLTVPNPVSYFRLASVFDQNKMALDAEWKKSPYSGTTPVVMPPSGRGIAPNATDRASARIKSRVGAKYLLKTDIAQFYPSIYSHSIPWVLHSKPVAKTRHRDLTLFGNLIDKAIQACQDGQTKGIAIGPETSLGIAETLLSPIDERLSKSNNIVGGLRFIDDIELTFKKIADAENALGQLENLLGEFELQLNPAKTKITELPQHIESPYVSILRQGLPAPSAATTAVWIDYFNRALQEAHATPSDTVLRYAIGALKGSRIAPKPWLLVQSLLWQCIAVDPGCIRFVVDILLLNRNNGLEIDRQIAGQALNALIEGSSGAGHGSEVVWSIWAAMTLNAEISSQNQTLIASMDDPFVACSAMLARDHGVFSNDFLSSLWKSWIEEDSFKAENWIYVYEAQKRGWHLGGLTGINIDTSDCAQFLMSCAVDFLAEDIVHTYVPSSSSRWFVAGGGGY